MIPPPGGPGPYFCALFFNTSVKCKKQTHLFAHTFPHLAIDQLNKTQSKEKRRAREESDDCWIMMLKVGPFCRWDQCCSFLQLWSDKTRGKEKRFNRGVELFWRYQSLLGLRMWVQSKERNQAVYDTFNASAENKATLIDDDDAAEPIKTTTIDVTLDHLSQLFAHDAVLQVRQIKEANAAVDPPKRKKLKPL